MLEETRLPRNGKEGLLYGGIIAFITALIMMMVNIGIAFGGLGKETWVAILKTLPFAWVIAMLVETLLVGRIAEKLVNKFTEPSDGFNTKILFNILFCVTGMSAIMTVVGGMLGHGFSLEPILTFPSIWPRNFCVALWCEILLAQPVARFAMKTLHKRQAKTIKESEVKDDEKESCYNNR